MKQKSIGKTFEARVKVTKWLHYKDGWGIYGCKVVKSDEPIKLNSWGNFTIAGNVPTDLIEGKEYSVILGELQVKNDRESYPIIQVKMEKLNSVKAQQEFLKSIVTEKQYNAIMKVYPKEKILDAIMDAKIDLTKVKGIGNKVILLIKEKIREYRDLGSLITKLSPLGVTMNSIQRIAKEFGSPFTATKEINDSIYNLCKIKGFGFKKVDAYAMNSEENPTSIHRIKACLHYIISEQTKEGHSWISKEDLIEKANELLQIELIHIVEFLDTCNDKPIFKEVTDDEGNAYEKCVNFHEIININGFITITHLYLDEHHTYESLKRLNVNYSPPLMSNVDNTIQQAESELGITYTEEQRLAIKEAMKSGVYVLNGSAGTGKTTILKGIVAICNELKLEYSACALSGKAAQVLASKGIESSTIHRLLKYRGDGFAFDEKTPLPYDVIILDEASMVNANLWNHLTSAIKTGAKLIIVGDSGQLSGIGHGDVMRDLLDSQYFSGRELKQIHRQAEDSGVIEVAHKVRNGEQLTPYVHKDRTEYSFRDTYGNNKDITLFTFNDREVNTETTKKVIQLQIEKINNLSTLIEREQAIKDFQVLVANKSSGNLSTVALNKYVQTLYNPDKKDEKSIKHGQYEFKRYDKVIVSGNSYGIPAYELIDDYKLGLPIQFEGEEKPHDLFNGTIGIIDYVDVENNCLLVRFEGMEDILICIDEEHLSDLELAYAITVHRSQGLSIPNVLVAIDFTSFMLLSKQLVYTAITRTSGKCVLIAETGALYRAIKNDSSNSRRTFMRYFLKK